MMRKTCGVQALMLVLLLGGCTDDPTSDPLTPSPGLETEVPVVDPTPTLATTGTQSQAQVTGTQSATPTSPSATNTLVTATQASISPSELTATQALQTPTTVLQTPTVGLATPSEAVGTATGATPGEISPTAHQTDSPVATASPTQTAEPTPTAITDNDGDGFGAEVDCDDNNGDIYPGAEEVCDLEDNDCNDLVDDGEGIEGQSTYYADQDDDGFGNSEDSVIACNAPIDYVDNDLDCDDANPALNPDTAWYEDADSDGYGNADSIQNACVMPEGYVANAQDCDDTNADLNPQTLWYADGDQDLYGNGEDSVASCLQPPGYVDNDGDCDDANAQLNPETSWYQDGDSDGYGDPLTIENSCTSPDGYVDNNLDCDDAAADTNPDTVWYYDSDSDSYGDEDQTQRSCEQPSDYVSNDEDCNDEDTTINPDTIWYIDYDQDQFGSEAYTVTQCPTPDGYVQDNQDCNDLDEDFYPGAPEEDCSDPNDYNCDGQVGFANQDGDAFAACDDCDDSNSDVYPGAPEICNGIDDDCDQAIDDADDNVEGLGTFYQDSDGDDYGSAEATTVACLAPDGYVENAEDCDDSDAAINPETVWYIDVDEDAYGSEDPRFTKTQCVAPEGYVSNSDDCNDGEAQDNPAATERCDEDDNDCDDSVDESPATDAPIWYIDSDLDGYGAADGGLQSCVAPGGYVALPTDCNDDDTAVNPDADEICNGIDDDCDGVGDIGIIGEEAGCSGLNCLEIVENREDAPDGIYWIQPDEAEAAYEAYCDMTVDGGGWTLVASAVNREYFSNTACHTACNDNPQTTCTEVPFSAATVYGDIDNFYLQDYKSPAYSSVPFQEFLFTDPAHQYATYQVDEETQDSVYAWYPVGLQNHVAANVEFHSAYSYPVKETNISTTLNYCGSLTLAFNVEDSDSSINGSCHTSVKGPSWPTANNNTCYWDDGGVVWTSRAFYPTNSTGARMWLVR